MKKVNIIFVFILILFANACNKESVIEGTVVNPTVVVLNKTVSLFAATAPINLNIDGNIAAINLQVSAFKANAGFTNVTSVNDSVRFNSISISSSTFSVNGTPGTGGYGSLTKYTKADGIPTGTSYTGSIYFVVSKKSPPYTSPYASINSNIIISGGSSFTPQYSLNSDGYFAFKYTTYSAATGTVNYYGWVHVVLTQNEITFDKYAYQKDFPIKVGQEE